VEEMLSPKDEKQRRKELKKAYKKTDVPKDSFVRGLFEASRLTAFCPSDAEAISDEELEWRVVVVVHNKIGRDYANEEAIVSTFSRAVQALFSTSMVESEIANGGFSQFFSNQKPYLAALALEGYEFLGCPIQMEAVREAIVRRDHGLTTFKEQNRVINDLWRESRANKAARIRNEPGLFAIDCDA
jgi:hypothetical protein